MEAHPAPGGGGPPPDVDRGRRESMARRVERDAARAGVAPAGVELLGRALRAALAAQAHRLPEGHVGLLHPARTVLILLADSAEREPRVLAAAALAAAGDERIGDAGLQPSATLARSVPRPEAADGLAEALVVASPSAARIALAAWLDRVRHLHLEERDGWAAAHRLTLEVYLPVAERAEPALARRLAWWAQTFRRRFLGG